uniref:RNA helicase n=1 Tax=Globodera rostochiensis TaxID=31243 RepID=A0A914GUG6_GLORO
MNFSNMSSVTTTKSGPSLFGFSSATTTTAPASLFGMPSATTTTAPASLFGMPSATTTTAPASLFSFPSASTTKSSAPLFGMPSATTTTAPASLFGMPSAMTTTASSSLFGMPSATTTTASAPLFGMPSATTTTASAPLFGMPSATTTTASSSLFGMPSATTTTASAPLFGMPSATTTTASAPLFGMPSATTTTASAPLFGMPSATTTTASSSLFGMPSATTTTASSSLFGMPSATTTTASAPLFGMPSATTTTASAPLFGMPSATTTTASAPLFGMPSATTTTASAPLFGMPSATTTTASAPLFGMPSATTTTASAPLFGMPSATTTTASSSLFGMPSATTTTASAPLFGMPSATTTTASASLFGLPTSSAATIATTAPPIPPKMNFKDLQQTLLKLRVDFEQQEKYFMDELDDLNAFDIVLRRAQDKVFILGQNIDELEQERERFVCELDIMSQQQTELDLLVTEMEKIMGLPPLDQQQLSGQPSVVLRDTANATPADVQRQNILQLQMTVNAQMKQLDDELGDLCEQISDLQRLSGDANGLSGDELKEHEQHHSMLEQIHQILRSQLDTLVWVDKQSAVLMDRVNRATADVLTLCVVGMSEKTHTAATNVVKSGEKKPKPFADFKEFDFDDRLLKAIAEMGWDRPTPVQSSLIPLALDGKNVLARARTGSGKTAAFLLPLIQKIIQLSQNSKARQGHGPFSLIIAPTKELASQIFALLERLSDSLVFIQSLNLALFVEANDETLENETLDVLVSTPRRLLVAVKKVPKLLANVGHVVLDEADLLFSYGYRDEIKFLKGLLPPHFQTVMTSATLNEDMTELKRTFVVGKVLSLKLKESDLPGIEQLQQFQIQCLNDEERFSILLAMIKLKLLVGKSVVFVSGVNRCYKLHLFFQAFKIASCVLNAQMPANSRCRIIHEFNAGRWPYIIASECNDIFDGDEDSEQLENGGESAAQDGADDGKKQGTPSHQRIIRKRKELKKKNKRRQLDKESGIGRGIDFHSVSNVINFDFPLSTDMYVHRVGRTARGFNKGIAISFASQDEWTLFEMVRTEINERMGQPVIQPYEVQMRDFESFQLRARDVMAACTKTVIRETRMAEIRAELLKSKRLDAYFEKNPREKRALEQDRKQFKLNVHSTGIADVPDYIVPKALRGQDFNSELKRPKGERNVRKRKRPFEKAGARRKHAKMLSDPLQSFKF